MQNQDTRLPWTLPGWFAQASAWIQTELERQGINLSGPITQPHIRPWSTVLHVPTTSGVVYFKATAPMLSHEPALTQALARWRPDCMVQVLATDLARGWMLMPDGGVMLRSLIQSDSDLWHWHRVLPIYAEVQIALAERLQELLALGALDRRLTALPAQYEQLLADTGALLIDQPDGLTSEEYDRLCKLAPRFTAECQQLAGYRLPETLHHDDFHDGNIFVHEGHYSFSDWGESCAAHPFFTMVVTLRSIAYRLNLAESDPKIVQLRDSYLEPWTRYEPRATLSAAVTLARRVGMVCRALTWYQVVSALEEPFRAEHAEATPGWLQEFLNAETAAAA